LYKIIESFINENDNGLFLLDSPTGFGKTTTVIEVIKDFLSGKKFEGVKRMFFVTNLKKNLPFKDLIDQLSDDEKKQCLLARSYEDSIIENFGKVNIQEKVVTDSEEYKNLKSNIEDLNYLSTKIETDKSERLLNLRSNLRKRIATHHEPIFRNFLQKQFFFNKSVVDKKKFINENAWFRFLYPISQIEKFKVVFLTTKKFFSPISTFYRMPFYACADQIIENSVVFIDEFDASKKDVLNQIIDDGLISKVDTIKLFKNIHYALQNVEFPESLLRITDFSKDKIDAGDWKSPSDVLRVNKELFYEKYKQYNFDYLLKSFDLGYRKAFLFDDGRHITVFKDNSKKHLITNLDGDEKFNKILAVNHGNCEKSLNALLRDVIYCVGHFAKGVKMLSKNYHYFKNTTKSGFEEKYNYEEAVKTIIDAFNISEEYNDYLFKLITKEKLEKVKVEGIECRKGFKFTEVEDSNYHDLQSIAHTFNYDTTPEDLIIMLSKAAKVIGISATASIKTVIGNYDIDYIVKILGESYVSMSKADFEEMKADFFSTQKAYEKDVKIKVEVIDNLNSFSDKEKCKILLGKIFAGEHLDKYLKDLDSQENFYYYFQAVKLAYLYKGIGVSSAYSFIAFLNLFPRKGGNIDTNVLDKMFVDVAENNGFEKFEYSVIRSALFEHGMEKVYKDLKEGKKHFVISTYQTIGSGKNIQYEVPEAVKCNMVLDEGAKYCTKDFDGIYLSTPTHLVQLLNFDADDKYKVISKFLFQQQYLYFNKLITYGEMRYNIINGFKRLFFSDKYNVNYGKNLDIYLHTAQYLIQAVGRICRCRHKNKEILIFTDLENLERLDRVRSELDGRLFNSEFSALLNEKVESTNTKTLESLTATNKAAYWKIKKMSDTVRSSPQNIVKWKELREYVLKNPTAAFVPAEFKDLYFEFDSKQDGYSYAFRNYNLSDLKFDKRLNLNQVSEIDCDLPQMLMLPYISEIFEKQKYAKTFKQNNFVMSVSLYKQVYKGALGEVVGKEIVERQCGIDLEELEEQSHYEFFDYKYKNLYFDFKHWDEFVVDADSYVKKVQRKLNRIKGEKCVVINIVKRGEHIPKINIDDTVIQIPYLIDDETGDIDADMIEKIEEAMSVYSKEY